MKNLKILDLTTLKDMLAQHIKEYTAILFSEKREGIDAYEEMIFLLQDEIGCRDIALRSAIV